MKEKYRVVIIVPAGYSHSQCFTEVAFLIRNSLKDLEIDCDLTINELAADRINVLLGFHLIRNTEVLKDFKYIPYQLEQLSSVEGVFSDSIKTVLSKATAVWDYSQENVVFLEKQGIKAKHVPVGFHKSLQQIALKPERDIDVLFFGSMGQRRESIMNQLASETSLRVKTLFGAYGKERDDTIGRAKIIINIHFYNAKIFEAVRVSYLLNNACCVVSEDSAVYPYPAVKLPLVPYDSLVETCRNILANGDDFGITGKACFEQFKEHYSMVKFLTGAVAGTY